MAPSWPSTLLVASRQAGLQLVTAEAVDAAAHWIVKLQDNAAQRGQLNMWSIYHRPKDYPAETVARRFEIGKGGPVATDNIIVDDLEGLRAVFRASGLVCVCRQPNDDVVIVESWI